MVRGYGRDFLYRFEGEGVLEHRSGVMAFRGIISTAILVDIVGQARKSDRESSMMRLIPTARHYGGESEIASTTTRDCGALDIDDP
jgi:hypothetical protein